MKPICVKCQRFYRMTRVGVRFIEAMPTNGSWSPPGTTAPDQWQPYKLWAGDLWTCQGCGHELISGVGRVPITEHYKPDFKEIVIALRPIVTINDC
jgi:hypothetical protein